MSAGSPYQGGHALRPVRILAAPDGFSADDGEDTIGCCEQGNRKNWGVWVETAVVAAAAGHRR